MNKITKEEEERFVEEEQGWTEGDRQGLDKGAVTIDKETAVVDEERFVEEEGSWVDKPGTDKGAVVIDKEKASVEEKRFFNEEREWVEGDEPSKGTDINQITAERIQELRKELPDTSETAKAIDAGAPWMEISQLADQENFHQIASLLFEAEQQGLED